MVAPSTIDIPSTGSVGPDIYAATRVVSLIAGDGTDLTIAAALAALPASGGKIFVKQGVYPQVATLTFPDAPVVIEGASNGFAPNALGTVIDIGANLIAAFTKVNKKYIQISNLIVRGTGLVGQQFLDASAVADSDNYVILNNVNIDAIQTGFFPTAGAGDNFLVRMSKVNFTPSLALASKLWTSGGGAAGGTLEADQCTVTGAVIDGNPNVTLIGCRFDCTQAVAFVNLIGSFFASSCQLSGGFKVLTGVIEGCTFSAGTFGVPPVRYLDFSPGLATVTGCIFQVDATTEAIRISGGTTQAQITGCVFLSSAPGTRVLNLTVPSGANIANCDFHGGSSEQIQINATSLDVTIVGCNFTDDGGGPRAIDIIAAAFRICIVGCDFKFFSTEAIRVAGARVMVVGCTGCKVVETITANNSRYSNNDGFDPSTISVIGNASLIENENVRSTGVDLLLDEFTRTVTVDATGAARTITLPTAASAKWRKYSIKKIDATVNTVTIDADAAETIDGALTVILTIQYQSITIQSDGTTWWII